MDSSQAVAFVAILGQPDDHTRELCRQLEQAGIPFHVAGDLPELDQRQGPPAVILLTPPLADCADGLDRLGDCADMLPSSWRVVMTQDTSPTHLVMAVNRGSVESLLPWPCPPVTMLDHVKHGIEHFRERGGGRNPSDRLQRAEVLIESLRREINDLEQQGSLAHLVGGLAHEMNNPLGAILGHGQRLQRRATDPAEVKRRADIITSETERCIELVAKLRSYASPVRESRVLCHLPDHLKAVLTAARNRRHSCPRLSLPRQPNPVMAGSRSLQQVLEQIIDNAVLAGSTAIVVDQETVNDRCLIHLDNNGETPSDEVIAHAVKPFFTERSDEGHQGMGLSLAAALMREMGGSLTMARNPTGTGARLTLNFELPSARTTQVFGRDANTQPHVLLIDDEPMIAELLVDMLQSAGCQVTSCGSITEARTTWNPSVFVAVICDVNLPDGAGTDFVRELMNTHDRLHGHVALTTGDPTESQLIRDARDLGTPIIGKPFRMADLQHVVESIVS